MSKLDDYSFEDLGVEVVNFKDDTRDLLNNGKVGFQVISTVPSFRGIRGEMVWAINGTDGRLYMMALAAGTEWTRVVSFTTSG